MRTIKRPQEVRMGSIGSEALVGGRLRMFGDRWVNVSLGIEREESEMGWFDGHRKPCEGS
jgi:hypothetical protein